MSKKSRRQYVRDRLGRFAGSGAGSEGGPAADGGSGALTTVPRVISLGKLRDLALGTTPPGPEEIRTMIGVAERVRGYGGLTSEMAQGYLEETARVPLPRVLANPLGRRVTAEGIQEATADFARQLHAESIPPEQRWSLDRLMDEMDASDKKTGYTEDVDLPHEERERRRVAFNAEERRVLACRASLRAPVEGGWSNYGYLQALSERMDEKRATSGAPARQSPRGCVPLRPAAA